MAKFTEYITSEGDRWDTIATKAYGDPYKVGLIIEANPNLPIDSMFEGGVSVAVPIIDVVTEEVDPNDLPPWKR
jgi:phage tail protein X